MDRIEPFSRVRYKGTGECGVVTHVTYPGPDEYAVAVMFDDPDSVLEHEFDPGDLELLVGAD